MKGATALKKINARVKKLAKRYPGKKRSTLQKQAGKEYREGKLKTHRKAHTKKARPKRRRARRVGKVYHVVVAGKRRRSHRRRHARVGAVRRRRVRTRAKRVLVAVRGHRRRTVHHKKRVHRRRRVGGMGKTGKLVLLLGGAAILYLLLKPKPQAAIVQTANPVRNNQTATIISLVTAAGATATQIANIIAKLNAASDTQVSALSAAAASNAAQLTDDSAVQSILTSANTGLAGHLMG